jgi:hypothetical protein
MITAVGAFKSRLERSMLRRVGSLSQLIAAGSHFWPIPFDMYLIGVFYSVEGAEFRHRLDHFGAPAKKDMGV